MSIFNKVKNALVYTEDPTTPQQGEDVAPQPSGSSRPTLVTAPAQTNPAQLPSHAVRSMVVDQKLVEQIMANLAKGTSGAYSKFLDMMGKLTMIEDGPRRIQAACAAAVVNAADVIAEVDRRIAGADHELEAAENAANSAREQRVGSIQRDIARIDSDKQAREEEVNRLQEQIRLLRENLASLEQNRLDLVGKIPGEESKINEGLNKFRQAHSHVKAQLVAEKATLQSMTS